MPLPARTVTALEQVGISPKVVAATVSGVVAFLILKLGIQLDPVIEEAINVLVMAVAGVVAPPGTVKVAEPVDVVRGE